MPITVVGLAKRSNGSLRFNKCELGPSRLLSLPLFFSVTLHIISFEPRGKHPRPPPLERRLQRHNHYVTYFCHTGHITYSFTTSSVHTTTCYLSRPSARRGRHVGAARGGHPDAEGRPDAWRPMAGRPPGAVRAARPPGGPGVVAGEAEGGEAYSRAARTAAGPGGPARSPRGGPHGGPHYEE